MGEAAATLALERVTKRFGRGPRAVEAVREVTVELAGGQVVALLGPNGAGKTTLLRMVAGLVDPTSGSIRIRGRELGRERQALQRRTGWCSSDERTFYPRLSCLENLRLFAALYGLDRSTAEERIRARAEVFGLRGELEKPFQVCSAGGRQKLGLVRALLHEPDVLLLDEPVRSLDRAARETLAAVLRDFAARGDRLAIVAGHEFEGVESLRERTLVLRAGRLDPSAWAQGPGPSAVPSPPGSPLPATPASDQARRSLRAALALARRDRLVFQSHRFQLGLKVGLLAAWIVTLHFMSGLVDTSSPRVSPYLSTDYFTFALLGLAFLRISQVSFVQMASALREEQIQGTIEPLVATGQPPILLLLGSLVWPLSSEIVGLSAVFGLGAALLGADLSAANVPAFALATVATVLATAVWGILSAAFVIAFKRGDPVALLVHLVTIALSGVFFPVEMIPAGLQPFARLLPLTWGLEAVRAAALHGAGFGSPHYLRPLLGLAVLAAVLAPLSAWALRSALAYARRTGGLAQA